jgi:putative nucleotidyltransferase with HDIG domain
MIHSVVSFTLENNIDNTPLMPTYFPSERISELYDLFHQIVVINSLDVLLDTIVQKAVDILRVKYCRILIIEPDGNFLCQASSNSGLRGGPLIKWQRALPTAQNFYQKVLQRKEAAIISQGSEVNLELRYALHASQDETVYLLPMIMNQESIGILEIGDENRPLSEPALREKMRLADLIAGQASSAIYRVRLSHRLEENQLQTVLALTKVLDSRDPRIGKHCLKVTEAAVTLAQEFNYTSAEIQTLRWAGLLHDIGKVGIRDEILYKKGSLNDEEWEEIRCHPERGAEIVRMASNLDEVARLILAHHERFDGKGYPYGVKKECVPFGARILAVADAYSAMTDERPYRSKCSMLQVIEELKRCSGTQFDPKIVEAFIRIYSETDYGNSSSSSSSSNSSDFGSSMG